MSKPFDGTTATLYVRSDGRLIGYHVEGHSGYAEEGSDIVCAMISILTQTTLGGLTDVLKIPVMFEIDDAHAMLEARFAPEATEDQIIAAQALLETMKLGLTQVAEGFPKNLRIKTTTILKKRR